METESSDGVRRAKRPIREERLHDFKTVGDPVDAMDDRQRVHASLGRGRKAKYDLWLDLGVRPSTGSVGDAYDNAMCESFFATLECELIDRRRFRSHSEARMAVFQFIEGFYNPSRRHSALGYLSPIEYERKHDGLSKPA